MPPRAARARPSTPDALAAPPASSTPPQFLIVRRGLLAKVWLAAHMLKTLKSSEILNTDIRATVVELHSNADQLGLRECGQLLVGMTKIFARKVDHASTLASEIKRKMDATSDAAAPSTRASRAAGATAAITLDAGELRAKSGAINIVPSTSSDDRNLVMTGFAALGDFGDEFAALGELHGMEYFGDESALGDSYVEVPMADVHEDFTLTQSQQSQRRTRGQAPPSIADEEMAEDAHRVADDEVDVLIDDEEMPLDVSEALAQSMIDVTVDSDSALGDTPARPRKSDAGGAAADANADQDGGGFDFGADDDVHISPTPADEQDAEMTIDDALNATTLRKQLSTSAAADARVAKRKAARAGAYQPQIDRETEQSDALFRRWIDNTSDIVKAAGAQDDHAIEAAAKEALEHNIAAAFPPRPTNAQLLNTIGSLSLVNHHHQHLSLSNDTDTYHSRLTSLFANRFTASDRIAGIAYAAPVAPAAAAHPPSRSPSVLGGDQPMTPADHSGLGNIGADDEFGFGGGDNQRDESAWNEDEQEAGGEVPVDDANDGGGVNIDDDDNNRVADDDDAKSVISAATDIDDNATDYSISGSPNIDAAASIRAFWNERGDINREPSVARSASVIASGWSNRTKQMHTILKQQFELRAIAAPQRGRASKAPVSISYDSLVHGKVRAIGAGAFYQILVLASSGFLNVEQEQPYGDITVAKSDTFDSQTLPIATPQASEQQSEQSE